MPEDMATTSSKSDIDPCSHGRDPDRQKGADRQTDRRLFSFILYIYSLYIRQLILHKIFKVAMLCHQFVE